MNSTFFPKYAPDLQTLAISKYFLLLVLLVGGFGHLKAQMWNGLDSLYGNEWIDYNKSYYKIPVVQDGMYQISYEALQQSGLPLEDITGEQFQLFHLGEEVRLHLSTTSELSPSDYLLFYGEKNRGEIDRYLFKAPDEQMLNPQYSMYTDTAVYYLTWAPPGTPGNRYQTAEMNLTNLPAPEAYFLDKSQIVFSNLHSKTYARIDGTTLYRSDFTPVEGFGNGSGDDLFRLLTLPNKHRKNFNIDLPGLAPQSIDAALRLRFGCGPENHHQILQIDGEAYAAFQFFGFQVKDTTVIIPSTALRARLNIQLEGQVTKMSGSNETTQDGQTIAFAEVSYPRLFDFENQPAFFFPLPASQTNRYLEISNFAIGAGEMPVLYDLTAGLRYEAAYDNGKVKINLPPTNDARRFCLVNSQRGFLPATTPVPVPFINYDQQEGDYIILSHPSFFQDGNGANLVQEYANYRTSPQGGGYRSVVIDIHQLYEQFAYGVQRHPLAVRNFANYIKRKWSNPKYFFIIGKGREYPDMRTPEQILENLGSTFFVPSFGFPASDNLLLSNHRTSVPVLPVGRIAATNTAQIRIYLDKVKALEANTANPQTIEGRRWMKSIMHLGGGATPGEQLLIRNNLLSLEQIIENNNFGANVTSFYKTSSDAIEISDADRIFNTINKGLSIITFFGHSSPGTFDFNIESPDNYRNYGKYPLMLSLGCYSGNIFTNSPSISERFTFYRDKGAIAFGASRGIGFISSLGGFADQFYRYMGEGYYGRGIGDGLRATLARFDDQESITYKTLVQQFNLHGDPAIRLHPSAGPDYVIDAQSVRFSPGIVTAQLDSFALSFNLVNLGQYQKDSLNIRVRQALPSGQLLELTDIRVAAPANSESLTVQVPGRGSASVGQNHFFLIIDPDNEVSEAPEPAAKLNNELTRSSGEAGIPLFIIDNTARPVYPTEFGIVSKLPLTLKASTTNALATEQTYILELDTTALFNSPLKLRQEITQRGGVIQWSPALNLTPNEVYYWRISPDISTTSIGYAWEQSSFTYLPGSSDGWNQGDYWQWLEGDTSGLRGNEELRKLGFVKTFKSFRLTNRIISAIDRPDGFVNGQRWSDFFRWERPQSINIVVFDTLGQFMWNQIPGEYGSLNTTRGKEIACYLFPVDTQEERLNILNFIENIIPNNALVFVYPAIRMDDLHLNVGQWAQDSIAFGGKNLFNILENQGASQVRSLEQFMRPYIFVFRKDQGPVGEKIADSINETVYFEVSVQGFLPEGELTTPLIGPASSWAEFQWDYTVNHENDITQAALIGISPHGVETLLQDSIVDKTVDLSSLSARDYPFLKLKLYAKDSVYFTPVDLHYWRVLYEGKPDVAINPSGTTFSIYQDTLPQGDQLRLKLPLENVSDYPIDSLDIQYILSDPNNNETRFSSRIAGMPAQSGSATSFELATKDLQGANAVNITVNPGQNPMERTYFNNLGKLFFYVQGDQRNPLLDVTFDGQPIMDGDLVSAKPQINIRLEDENLFLLLKDTSLFDVSISYPDGLLAAIPLSDNPQVQFYPASGSDKNQASIIFTPEFIQDGEYRLLINARDASGNAAGELLYEKNFQVITKKAISNVLNYPNPFSTATQFVYTLTGDEPPAYFLIQIMTSSGRIVREITQADLGYLKIGTHRTEYVWDGRDEYGDLLANGVYLYRIIAKDLQGKDFDYHDNGLQSYFKHGIGKLVILR